MSQRIALFFTRGNSLETWDRHGMLEREIALYRALGARGIRTTFVTYGTDEKKYIDDKWGITVRFNHFKLPARLYEVLLPWLHRSELRDCGAIKTNQSNGATVAARASRLFGIPLIARCGYMWSEFAAEAYGPRSRHAVSARRIEEKTFRAAARIIVTTHAMRDDVIRRTPGAERKTMVIPNYVDTELFKPRSDFRTNNHIVFVGRLSAQKNLRSLLTAIRLLDDVTITVVGKGEQRVSLEKEFSSIRDRIKWKDRVPHRELPALFNSGCIFVLPSLYEGQPKVLLEAMACGLPVLGTDRPGIRELIQHDVNGLLCEPTSEGLRNGINQLLNDPAARRRIGAVGQRYVSRFYSLASVVRREMRVIRPLMINMNGN